MTHARGSPIGLATVTVSDPATGQTLSGRCLTRTDARCQVLDSAGRRYGEFQGNSRRQSDDFVTEKGSSNLAGTVKGVGKVYI